MFSKPKSEKQNEQEIDSVNGDEVVHEHPLVCLLDCSEEVSDELSKLKFNCSLGTLGSKIAVNHLRHRDEKILKINCEFPINLHEYDVLVIDFTRNNVVDYDPNQHRLGNVTGKTTGAVLSHYPEQIFNPIPFSTAIIAQEIAELTSKDSIVIAFCKNENTIEYDFVEIGVNGPRVTESESYSNLNFYEKVPDRKSRQGRKVSFLNEKTWLSPLLQKYLREIEYGLVFDHPAVWKDKKTPSRPKFFSLVS